MLPKSSEKSVAYIEFLLYQLEALYKAISKVGRLSASLCRHISLRNKRYYSLTSIENSMLKCSIELDQQTQLKKSGRHWLIVTE